MIPLALSLKNFRSFRETQRFTFPSEPGLYFMQGVNEVEPTLGGNAAGKTTLWDALTWCSYGVTADGLKAGDVCNWDEEGGTEVEFDFCFDDEATIWTLRRTWKPITWTLSHVAEQVTDEEVIDLTKDGNNAYLSWLRLELEPWLACVMAAQGRPMFLDLKSEAQASLFSEVLGLERWVEFSKRMSERAKLTDDSMRELEKRRSHLAGELDQVERQDFSEAHDRWEVENAKRVLGLDTDHKKGVRALKDLEEALEVAEKREAAARVEVGKHQGDPEDDRAVREHDEHIRSLEDQLLQRNVELDALEAHAERLEEGGKCPTCGTELTRQHIREELERARKAKELRMALVDRTVATLREVKGKRGNLVGRLRAQDEALAKAREELEDCCRATSGARRAAELQGRELDRIEEEAERLASQENPYAGMARQATRNASRLREEQAAVQSRLDALAERWALQSYWAAKGFKEIRLQEIAQALTELEIEVNSAVTALGLRDWELRFAVDKEGKGGSVQRGFNVLVKSPKYNRATPWRSWSGGEKQRLRLAANMGLADLIRSRTGARLNLEVWDEPTNGLSPEGWRDLFDSLASRARHEERVIFITDHKAHDYGGFAGTATVIKRPSGSTVRTTW